MNNHRAARPLGLSRYLSHEEKPMVNSHQLLPGCRSPGADATGFVPVKAVQTGELSAETKSQALAPVGSRASGAFGSVCS